MLKKNDHHYSQAKVNRMKAELKRLEDALPAARAELRRTQEMGDLSENAAYSQAKYELRRMNTRILVLAEKIKSAIIIESGSPDGVIQMGSIVEFESNGEVKTFEILGPAEANPMQGKISYLSPLGKTFIGKRKGDEFEFNDRSYRIISIK